MSPDGGPPPPVPDLAVVILTRDEELHVERAVRNVAGWAGQVFVLDSHSRDRTCEIASAAGATVVQQPFESHRRQREFALRDLPVTTEWLAFLDADELFTDEIKTEIAEALRSAPPEVAGFFLKRRFYWMNRWIRHGGIYPTWILRLVRRERAFMEPREINEHLGVHGETRRLQHDFLHVDLRTISDWLERHNRYGSLEALHLHRTSRTSAKRMPARLLGPQHQRKEWVRQRIFDRLPALLKPFAFFFYVYVLRLGFLDGRAGFVYHVLWGFCYPFETATKYVSLRRTGGETINGSGSGDGA